MTEMKILPVERAIEWIRAWTELDWPITWETAFATPDKLGWTSNPQDPELFTTELSANGKEDGYLSKLDSQCSGAYFPLSSRDLSAVADERWTTSLRTAYDNYIKELTYLYGVGEASSGRSGRRRTEWILANQVTLNLSVSDKSINVAIKSPAVTAINERERYYIEKYGENYVDD